MTKVSATDAKTHFGALIDKAQKEPVTIEKQGRPVAVVISFDAYTEQHEKSPSASEKKKALQFLSKWSKRPAATIAEDALEGDIKARAIWEKYTRTA